MALVDAVTYMAVLSKIGIVPLAVTSSLSIVFLRRPSAGRPIEAHARARRGEHLMVRLFRQRRDTRFSKDKSPYKITAYGVLADPASEDGAYLEISSKGLYAGRGNAKMARDQLERFRAAVVSEKSGVALERAIARAQAGGLTLQGAALARGPRGAGAHPRAILLRHDALVAGAATRSRATIGTRAAIDWVDATWNAAEPLAAWLSTHVGKSEIPPEVRWGRGGASRR